MLPPSVHSGGPALPLSSPNRGRAPTAQEERVLEESSA